MEQRQFDLGGGCHLRSTAPSQKEAATLSSYSGGTDGLSGVRKRRLL